LEQDWFSGVAELQSTRVVNFCFVVEPWSAKKIQAELQKRGLTPVAENDGKGFESFHVKEPNGWDLQISNGQGLAATRVENNLAGSPVLQRAQL
jgi:hypothetical protein